LLLGAFVKQSTCILQLLFWGPFKSRVAYVHIAAAPRTTGSVTGSECHLFVLFKGFLTGVREVALDGEEGEGIGGKLPPNMLKKP